MKRVLKRAGRAALLIAALGSLPWLGGCAEPSLVVVVSLPDEIERDGLTVELSVFTPTTDSDVDCDQIAFGDVRLPELRAARVFHQRLLAPEAPAQAIESQATTVDRAGTKIALALGAYDFDGSEIGDLEAVLAGCVEIGEVEADTRVELKTGPTAVIVVERPEELSLSAVLEGEASAEIVVERRGPGGALDIQPEGLAVQLEDHLGRAISGSVRFRVIDGDGAVSFTRSVGSTTTLASTLQIDRAGMFAVDVRARFQRGAFSPLTGLAYHQLLDSDLDSGLASVLDRAAWVRPAALSAPDSGEWTGFLAAANSAGADPDHFDLVLARVDADLSTAVELLFAGRSGGPPSLLGFTQTALPKPERMAQITLAPVPGSPDPLEQQARLMLLPAPPPAPSIALPLGLVPNGNGVGIGACELGDEGLPLLLGLEQRNASAPMAHIQRYQRIQLGGPPPSLVLLDEHDDLTQGLLVVPAPMAFTQSLCIDDVENDSRRLLGAADGRSSIFFLLDGERVAGLNDIEEAARLVDGFAHVLRVEGQVQQSSVLALERGDRRVLLAAVWFDDQLEVNQYTLDRYGPEEALGFDANLLRIPMPVPPIGARLVVGDLLRSAEEPPGQQDLALVVIQISDGGTLAGQLYLRPLGPGPTMGQAALRVSPVSCIESGNACHSIARDSDLLAADLDEDGQDELLLVNREGTPPRLRAQVMGF